LIRLTAKSRTRREGFRGVVQGDMRGFTVKLTDFGLSQMLLDGQESAEFDGWGTMAYTAPELLARTGSLSTATDVRPHHT
jgi:serine/threonine protein kinase